MEFSPPGLAGEEHELEFQVLVLPFYNPGYFDSSSETTYQTQLRVDYTGGVCGSVMRPACAASFERWEGPTDTVLFCKGDLFAWGDDNLCIQTCGATSECVEGSICTPELFRSGFRGRHCTPPNLAGYDASCSDVESGNQELCRGELTCAPSADQFDSLAEQREIIHRCR